MRMPNARQISEEQQDIFEDAPISGSILVTGPPGTGKTVIAFLRAQALAEENIPATVLMYNRVLRRYTENVAEDIADVISKTMHSWLPRWWKEHCIEVHEEHDFHASNDTSEYVYIDSPFSDKDEVKATGAKWDGERKKWYVSKEKYQDEPSLFAKWKLIHSQSETHTKNDDRIYLNNSFDENQAVKNAGAKFDGNKKKWWISKEQFSFSPEKFEQWLKKFDPPELEKWHYDWESMTDSYLDLSNEDTIDWGHLIIDEAQDFPPNMFRFLHAASRKMEEGGITILADENQRLTEDHNATIDEIRRALRIKPDQDREFKLTKNFRNTKPIAEFAKFFYTGLPTGVPEIPEKQGSKPKLIAVEEQVAQADYIKNLLQFRGAQEVAIIVDSDRDKDFYCHILEEALPNYQIQSYSSASPKSSEELVFDKQGVISVLNRRSCKGLEFDMVFIPDLQNFSFDDTNLLSFQMNMYVMCSRARTELILMHVKDESEHAAILDYLPDEESDLIEYLEI